jgi:hypothetical protein
MTLVKTLTLENQIDDLLTYKVTKWNKLRGQYYSILQIQNV